MFKYRLVLPATIVGALLAITPFQNCSTETSFEAASQSLKSSNEEMTDYKFDHDPTNFKSEPITTFSPPLMDRQMVVAVLSEAFGPKWTVENSNIETLGQIFGKGCSPHNDTRSLINGKTPRSPGSEPCSFSSANYKTGLESFSTAARSSYLINSCSILTSTPATLDHFIEKLGSNEDVVNFSDQAILNAYRLFYISKPAPSRTVIDAIRLIGQSQKDRSKAWSAVAYTLCSQGHWQVL